MSKSNNLFHLVTFDWNYDFYEPLRILFSENGSIYCIKKVVR